jgi:hypothetical protein
MDDERPVDELVVMIGPLSAAVAVAGATRARLAAATAELPA